MHFLKNRDLINSRSCSFLFRFCNNHVNIYTKVLSEIKCGTHSILKKYFCSDQSKTMLKSSDRYALHKFSSLDFNVFRVQAKKPLPQ